MTTDSDCIQEYRLQEHIFNIPEYFIYFGMFISFPDHLDKDAEGDGIPNKLSWIFRKWTETPLTRPDFFKILGFLFDF